MFDDDEAFPNSECFSSASQTSEGVRDFSCGMSEAWTCYINNLVWSLFGVEDMMGSGQPHVGLRV